MLGFASLTPAYFSTRPGLHSFIPKKEFFGVSLGKTKRFRRKLKLM
jgi:hypothetical protein